jgi:hypothetical protein
MAKMPLWDGTTRRPWNHALSIREIDTLLSWVDEGALENDSKDPSPPVFPEEEHLIRSWTVTRGIEEQ